MEAYSHIVSLGRRCATSHNLRRYFNYGEGFPFDWWITPFEGLLQVLERPDVDWLYDPSLMRLTDARRSVRHTPSGILFHHEFAREQGAPRELGESPPVREDFLEHLATPRARTAHLLRKFLALNESGNRILFIRETGERDKLEPVLAKRFSRADWTLETLAKVCSPDFKPADGKQKWQGDPVLWDRILMKLNARLDNPSLKPFRVGSGPEAESAIHLAD